MGPGSGQPVLEGLRPAGTGVGPLQPSLSPDALQPGKPHHLSCGRSKKPFPLLPECPQLSRPPLPRDPLTLCPLHPSLSRDSLTHSPSTLLHLTDLQGGLQTSGTPDTPWSGLFASIHDRHHRQDSSSDRRLLLIVPEAGSLSSRHEWGWSSWHVDDHPLPVSSRGHLCVCVCVLLSPSHRDTGQRGSEPFS